MSTEQPQPDPDESTVRLPSLAALQEGHRDLLQDRRQNGDSVDVFDRVRTLIRLGQATGALLDSEEDRSTAQAILDYWSAILFKAGQMAPDATLAEFDPELAPLLPDALCPYVGLDPFREATRNLFYGRERMVATLLERMRDDRLLVVVGPSGCGKSSIVLAGLLPALENGALPDSQNWRYAPRMVPGSEPLANLGRVMLAMQAQEVSDPVAWARKQEEALRQNPQHLTELANTLSPMPVVGVVDQFEEVFTLCAEEEARRAFLENLANLVRAPGAPHRIILTIREDFEPFVARFPEFQALFESAMVRVTPLSAAELRDAIEKPAQKVGLKFESGLVDQLLHDVLGEPAALPLLQFTLLKLWDHRARNRITWQAYNRLGSGRLALARSADKLYEELIPADQTTAKLIFLRLARPGEGLEFTSNRVRLRTLFRATVAPQRVQGVLDKLIAARLVRVTEGDIATDAQIEVAHEALIRNWPRLVDWLREELHTLRQRQVLTDGAERWNASGRDPGALYSTETLLDEALRVVENSGNPLNEQETEFIQASRRMLEEARQAKEEARQRELEQQHKLAEAEKQRADEQTRAAEAERQRADAQTKAARRLWWLVGVLLILVLGAFTAAGTIQKQREMAIVAQNAAEAGATQVVVAKVTTEAGATQVLAAKVMAEAGATQVAAAKGTAEAGATDVAANLQHLRNSLGSQYGLIDQVQTASAENAVLIAQIQTLEANPTGSPMPTFTPTAAPVELPPTAQSRLTPTRTPPWTATPGGAIQVCCDTDATATVEALATQRSQVQAALTELARTATPQPTLTPTVEPQVEVGKQGASVRTGPDTVYPVIGTYRQGTKLRLLGRDRSGAWLRVSRPENNAQGWIARNMVKANVNLDTLPEVAAPPPPRPSPARPLTPTPSPTRPPTPRPSPPRPTTAPAAAPVEPPPTATAAPVELPPAATAAPVELPPAATAAPVELPSTAAPVQLPPTAAPGE